MKLISLVGIALGVLVGTVLLCLASVWIEKNHPADDYDERQRLVRGRADGLSLGVGLVYFLGVLIVLERQVSGEKTVEPYLLVVVGVLLMMVVNHTYCLIGHAALPLSQKPVWCIVGYLTYALCDFVRFSWLMEYYEALSWVGNGSMMIPHLLIGITAVYLALAHTIQLLRDRKERS